MMLCMQKKNPAVGKGNRLLISIGVLGSAGPIRFVVNEDDLVGGVIDTTLKSYAREGRLPLLDSRNNSFVLHCPNSRTEALSPREAIGSTGLRNFMLFKKSQVEETEVVGDNNLTPPTTISRKGSRRLRAWFNKSLYFNLNQD